MTAVVLDRGHWHDDPYRSFASVDSSRAADAMDTTTHRHEPRPLHGSIAAAELRILADSLDDLEKLRIATDNRIRALAQVYGITDDDATPEVLRLRALADGITKLEHSAELDLCRAVRHHPLAGWVKRTIGIGEKQGARLIAAIGDPYWNTLHDRPRTVSELWAWCGYKVVPVGQGNGNAQKSTADGHTNASQTGPANHSTPAGVAQARRRGERANWSAEAKMRAFLVAESCVKQAKSPYRPVYDATRLKHAEAVHASDCRRCGPAGKPAQAGSPLSPGHQHARALRAVAKEVLKDLWREARALHVGGQA